MQTPPKTSFRFIPANFQATQNDKNSVTLEKLSSHLELDHTKTPKQVPCFYPFMDRRLRSGEFKHIKNNRARLLAWLLQIYSSYELGWESFWFAVQLLDALIVEFRFVNTENIHLVGIVCCFISAKMKGTAGFKMRHVIVGLGHLRYTPVQILQTEAKILKLVFKRSNFQRVTVFSFLMEKYGSLDQPILVKALEMICLAFLKPEVAYGEMGVGSYRELVDFVMAQVVLERPVEVLEAIRKEIQECFKKENVTEFVKLMKF